MKPVPKVFCLVLTLVFTLLPQTVNAGDYITDAAQALKSAPVYVAPGTEGTDYDTAGELQDMLNSGDNIVLVMLPTEALSGTDIYSLAKALSGKLYDQKIIGLAVGREVIGYSPSLPSGVAGDMMKRADSVSNDSVTALRTFAQNIHLWQADHQRVEPTPTAVPTPTPVPQSPQERQRTQTIIGLVFGAIVVIGIAVLFFKIRATLIAKEMEEGTHFDAPNPVKDLLVKIAKEREQINDRDFQQIVLQLCVDVERYFLKSSNDVRKDSLFFHERLNEVDQVLTKYIDVQQSPRYYTDPKGEMKRGKDSIGDFSQYVLDSIRRGTAADLLDYKVNTNILQAQRYR